MTFIVKLFTRISLLALLCVCAQGAYAMKAFTLVNAKTTQLSAHQAIRLNPLMKTLSVGNSIELSLSAAVEITMTVDKVSYLDNGDVQIFANGGIGSNAVFTLGQAASFATIAHNSQSYSIYGDENLTLTQLTHPSMPRMQLDSDGLTKPVANTMTPEKMAKIAEQAQVGGVSQVDLLVVYSSQFAQGFGAPLTRINQMIGFTNSSLQRSGISINIRLVQPTQLAFNDDTNNGTLLSAATNSQGDFSGLGALRNSAGADMVAVLTFDPGLSGSGIAWVNGDNPNFAYSVTRFSPVGFDTVFAHELGHNFGSGHERASVNPRPSPCTGQGFTPFACGHGNAAADWGTIMSRLNSERANNVFSSPSLTCVGAPCGIPQGQSEQADNVSAFNMSRLLISEFRPSQIPDPTPEGGNGNGIIAPVLNLLLEEE